MVSSGTGSRPKSSAFLVALFTEMFGFLLQWPTLVTPIMFPILVFMYVRLARMEEREAIAEFGEKYVRYASKTPAFFPRLPLVSRL